MNILKRTEFYSLKWWLLCCVNFISIWKLRKEKQSPNILSLFGFYYVWISEKAKTIWVQVAQNAVVNKRAFQKHVFITPGQMLALGEGLTFPSVCWMERDPYTSNRKPHVLSLSEGKYICHSYCRDLVHLDYPQNGKLPNCVPTCEVRHSSKKNAQVGTVRHLWRPGFQAVPSPVQGMVLLPSELILCVFTGSCPFLAITRFPRAGHIGSLTMGCDFRNSMMDYIKSLSNSFRIKDEALICVITCSCSGWGHVDRRTSCCWK